MTYVTPASTDSQVVSIEPVAGQPSRWLAHVGPITIAVSGEADDHRLRTRDLDLAVWLEFKLSYDIRKLIKRMKREGKLRDIAVVATVATTAGGRPGQEFWLTREQALLVATQSKTEKAWEVTEAMVKVFLAVDELTHTAAPAITPDLLAQAVALALGPLLAQQAEAFAAAVATVRDRGSAIIGERLARELIEVPLATVLDLHAESPKTRRSIRRSVQNRLQSVAQFTGPGCEWANLPYIRLADVQRALALMLREIPGRARKLDAKYLPSGPLFNRSAPTVN